jgi:basic membrane lipoprotein Med (substrate-binding protein (PBP1-ABC) superfamily)
MKEYKILKKSIWKKSIEFEDNLNQLAREGWEVVSAVGNNHGDISKVILSREKYKNS